MIFPKTIEPCPIIDALIEIRFSSNIPPNAVFGLVYSVLSKDFGRPESLPILQLPETVRQNDPNFKYKPHNKLSNNEIVVQVGPDVLAISSFPKYLGWKEFSRRIFNILQKIEKLKFINKIERIGLRYINFFNENIYNNIDLNLNIGEENISFRNTVIRTEINSNSFTSTLQISNNAIVNNKKGSLIDIDTWDVSNNNLNNFFKLKENLINEAHDVEKELFFRLLKQDFLEQLNPKY